MAKLRAPTGNGEVLAVPGFDEVPRLVEENRRRLDRDDVRIGGLPLRELRQVLRADLFTASVLSRPLLLAGHQPELSHPGVWVKNFALNGLARKLGGIPLHLIADTDTLKSTSIRFPVFRDRDPDLVHLETAAFDRLEAEVPFEHRYVYDRGAFEGFPHRLTLHTTNWGYEALGARDWMRPVGRRTVGEIFTAMRIWRERAWGCDNLELRVSRLSQTDAFARFASHILGDLPRFREVYNAAIRAYREANGIRSTNHPAPALAEGEAPFWEYTSRLRTRATASSDVRSIRPRALTLTLFARVCLGDFFIHGIGGGKYDEVTDAIIRDYFGIEPPAYQVLSATLHLPLPGFPSTPNDLKRAERFVRDLHWNPQRYLPAGTAAELVERKAALAAAEPPYADHAARKTWFRELQEVTERLRPFVADQLPKAEAELARIQAEVAANGILRRRDYSWVLYPEEILRPFLQQFLNV